MKRSYSHLNTGVWKENQYENDLFMRTTSPVLWRGNVVLQTFMVYLQGIIVAAMRRIRVLKNYQNPLGK